jgi:hypothetical protein
MEIELFSIARIIFLQLLQCIRNKFKSLVIFIFISCSKKRLAESLNILYRPKSLFDPT